VALIPVGHHQQLKSCIFLLVSRIDIGPTSENEWGTDIGLMLLALAIVASLLVGGTLPFFGGVVSNIVALVKDLGSNGLVGLISVGIIMWLFSKRSLG
jgi:hypothetical protein